VLRRPAVRADAVSVSVWGSVRTHELARKLRVGPLPPV